MKHANYGDGPQVNVTYNNRLLPTRYEMTNVFLSYLVNGGYFTVGTENDYYADGRLRYARDLHDGNFDRLFAYDHVGRYKEAYTGREARGLAPNNPADSPYRQSYTYDVWNNMSRTGRHWTGPVSDTPTYTNNRRADWTYNAEGAVTSRDEGQRTHAYDAAGQQRNFYEEGLQTFGGGHYLSHQYTINQTYDASGQAGKRVETRHSEDENGVLEDTTETTYQLHSTVLGGALIAQIDQWGGRRGHIYAGGQLLADYQYFPSPYTITTIRHRNPTTGQWVKNGVRTELDPLGADMGYTNPYALNLSYSDIMGADNLFYQRGNALDIRGGCALNGLPIPCSLANEAIAAETGSVAFEYRLNDGTLVKDQGQIYNLGAGLFIYDHPIVELDHEPGETPHRLGWRTGSGYIQPDQEQTTPYPGCVTLKWLLQQPFVAGLIDEVWDASEKSGEENGFFAVWDSKNNMVHVGFPSQGRHVFDELSNKSRPAMPEYRRDYKDFVDKLGVKVKMITIAHTHRDNYDRPSGEDVMMIGGDIGGSDSLGIIITGRGKYSLFDILGKIAPPRPVDHYLNECRTPNTRQPSVRVRYRG